MSDDARHDQELSPEEREAYDRLPREKRPGDLLEERVVRALKEEKLLGSTPENAGSHPPARWKPGWTVAAAAAALVLFASGMGLGQWIGARTATSTFLALQEQDAEQAADRVQATGSEYVRALIRFAELRPEGTPQEVAQGQEAALGAFLAAAEILARLEPDDAASAALLRFLEERRSGFPADSTGTRKTYWF